ncbi:Major facilitator superfamily domain-containing protein 6 [Halocaridina rubra]|uniref:Major facilitator superfamily domain-containing protein 6 n=1 Tax=Halocaridina rubra TaxID=373956 RepID=A0AAN8XCR8_HALRR
MEQQPGMGGSGGGGQFYIGSDQDPGAQGNQMTRPVAQGSRPFVDSEATGEVDPNAYPEPKESTHKIRGRSDILDMFCNNVNQELLIAKTFYFFFFSAFGSLFPLMAVYFKQLGMNPAQTGILIGIRPFVEFIAAPFWGSIADRFQKGKMMLLCAVGSWIVFTLSLGFVQPPATACVVFNGTNHILKTPYVTSKKKRSYDPSSFVLNVVEEGEPEILPTPLPLHELSDEKRSVIIDNYFLSNEEDDDSEILPASVILKEPEPSVISIQPYFYHKRSIDPSDDFERLLSKNDLAMMSTRPLWRSKRDTPLPPDHVIGKSPHVVHYTVNFKEFKGAEEDWLSPPFSSIVYRSGDVHKVFFLLLLLVLLGEFFSSPAITLADSAVLTYLGDEADHYGRQRMFGSLGWGLAMFFVGIALDHSTAFPGHPCGPHEKERNYTICFAVFSVLMGCAMITASQFKFDYTEPAVQEAEVKEPVDNGPRPWNEPKIPMQEQKSQRQKLDEAIGNIKLIIITG